MYQYKSLILFVNKTKEEIYKQYLKTEIFKSFTLSVDTNNGMIGIKFDNINIVKVEDDVLYMVVEHDFDLSICFLPNMIIEVFQYNKFQRYLSVCLADTLINRLITMDVYDYLEKQIDNKLTQHGFEINPNELIEHYRYKYNLPIDINNVFLDKEKIEYHQYQNIKPFTKDDIILINEGVNYKDFKIQNYSFRVEGEIINIFNVINTLFNKFTIDPMATINTNLIKNEIILLTKEDKQYKYSFNTMQLKQNREYGIKNYYKSYYKDNINHILHKDISDLIMLKNISNEFNIKGLDKSKPLRRKKYKGIITYTNDELEIKILSSHQDTLNIFNKYQNSEKIEIF